MVNSRRNLEFLGRVSKNSPVSNFTEILPVEPQWYMKTDGRTDGVRKLVGAFRECIRKRLNADLFVACCTIKEKSCTPLTHAICSDLILTEGERKIHGAFWAGSLSSVAIWMILSTHMEGRKEQWCESKLAYCKRNCELRSINRCDIFHSWLFPVTEPKELTIFYNVYSPWPSVATRAKNLN